VSGELVPRREALPEWTRETSALGELSRSIVTPMLAQDMFYIPSECTATIVAFPAAMLDREDVFAEMATDSDWTIFGALPALPSWARIVNEHDSCGAADCRATDPLVDGALRVHVATDERLAIFGAGNHLVVLLVVFGERVAFVSLGFGQIEAVALLLDHYPETLRCARDLVGLRVDNLNESPEALEALKALERLERLDHVDWLALRFDPDFESGFEPQHDASTLARLASISALRHLELGFTNAADLGSLDVLTNLRSLALWTDDGSEWRPHLPELRTLRVFATYSKASLVRPDGCPKLDRLLVESGGNADEFLKSVEQLPHLRHLNLRIYTGDRAPCPSDTISRLALLVQLRTLRINGRPYLDVSGGRLRHLETLTALETLDLRVIGATLDEIDGLAERLPSTRLKIWRYERFERVSGWFYDIDRVLSEIASSVAEGSTNIVWAED
jgi:hypothetical protein